MKKTILLLIILLASLNSVMAQAQKYQVKRTAETAYYLDPKYPEYTTSDESSPAWKKWRKAMDKYAMDHPPFPVYVSTGDVAADENTFAQNIEYWFMRNQYYPQYIDTGKPTVDLANWTKAKTEWCKRYPERCKLM